MTQPRSTRIKTRGRYTGMLENSTGLAIYFRLEHHIPGKGWVANGPVMEMLLTDDHVVGEAWYNALASSAERAMRLLAALRGDEEGQMGLPGID